MNRREQNRLATRHAILDAVADVVEESGALGFSIQEVADRAGVTHRTVYNHFATRDELGDAFAARVEEELATVGLQPDTGIAPDELAPALEQVYAAFGARGKHVRAYVMLMLASRKPAKVMRARTNAMQKLLKGTRALRDDVPARRATAAIRMFFSALGWHVLTEQLGLSRKEAAATATWAVRALLDAATESEDAGT